jgi:tyrosine-protein phosphatase SIW14
MLHRRLSLTLLSFIFLGLPVFAGSNVSGIKNFDQVDTHVYRGAQPSNAAFAYLAKIGVKTVIDLREAGSRSQAEQRAVTANGMQYINVPMGGFTPPTEAEITKILGILEDHTTGPVFVHCMHGKDRTGVVIAAYHIDHDKWDNMRALKDAKAHNMSMFQIPRQNYIRSFKARGTQAQTVPAVATPAVVVAR